MWWAWSKKFDKLFWASEHWLLDRVTAADATAPYEMHIEEGTNFKFWPTEENHLYSFDLNTMKKGAAERPNPDMGELLGKPPAPVAATQYSHNFPGMGGNSTNSTTTSHGTGTVDKKVGKAQTVVHLFVPDASPFGNALSVDAFEHIAGDGCSWCGAGVDYSDLGLVVITRQDKVLCPKCAGLGSAAPSRLIIPENAAK